MKRPAPRQKTTPDPVDVHVGSRVKLRRTILGMSQMQLAGQIGVTFQQVQKYERGTNRISASRLYDLSKVLDVPVSFYFDDMLEEIVGKRSMPMPGDPMAKREVLDMVRAYHAIPDAGVRKSLFDMIKALTQSDEEVPDRQ